MQVRELLTDDDAVSPVIGVILMVAITVILAAVIASFVLGLGNTQSATPTVSFNTDYSENSRDIADGNLTVTHDSGETVLASEVFVRGQSGNDTIGNYNDPWKNFTNAPQLDTTNTNNPVYDNYQAGNGNISSIASGTNSSDISGSSAVASGDFITFPVDSDADIDIVYVPEDSGNTATLAEFTGPDA